MRRSKIILALIFLSFLATVFGFFSKLKLSFCGLLAHAMFCISIIGGFYIYIMIDFVLTQGRGDTVGEGDHLSDTWVLLLSSTPFICIFIMGIYSCCLCIMVENEMDNRKNADNGGFARVNDDTELDNESHIIEILQIDPD